MERMLRRGRIGGSEGDVSAATVSLQPTANRVCQSVESVRVPETDCVTCVTISDKMLSHSMLALTLLALGVRADLADFELSEFEGAGEGDPRLFFANFTSSLVTVNSTLLAYALVGLAVAGAAGLALYYLYLQSASSGAGGYGYGNSYNQYGYQSRYPGVWQRLHHMTLIRTKVS